jgi:hypothetical protein
MPDLKTVGQDLVKGAGYAVGHLAAIVLGLILMVAGLAMGVSLVLLPVGIPVGLVGVLVLVWGLSGRTGEARTRTPPPA